MHHPLIRLVFFVDLLKGLHSSKLTWQWKMDPLKMYFHVFPIEYGDIRAMLVYQRVQPFWQKLEVGILPLVSLALGWWILGSMGCTRLCWRQRVRWVRRNCHILWMSTRVSSISFPYYIGVFSFNL